MAEWHPALLALVAQRSEEDSPFILQEPQELLSAEQNVGEGPRRKWGHLGQALQQIINQEIRQPHLAGMERQQHLQQLNWRLDELRHDAEAVHQHELLGFPLGQQIAVVILVRIVNSVQVGAIQSGDHRVVQLRKQLVEGKCEMPTRLEQIKGQLVQLLLGGT